MDESRAIRMAAWAGVAAVVLLVGGVALGYLVGVDDPTMSDADILARLNNDARQAAAGIAPPMVAAGVAALLWFATGLRRVLDRLSGGDPLAHAIVPAAALFGGLTITGVSLDLGSAFAAWSTEFTADPNTVRALGMAGQVLALTGLIGCGILVAVTTRITRQAAALPTWATWTSYAVAVLCLSGFWSGGIASATFALWLLGAATALLRTPHPAPPVPPPAPAPTAPAQGAPPSDTPAPGAERSEGRG
ncbi:hypothetical protein ACIA58_17235 [Kribbella sp. NPDC051586]|uniref:hypothetical protein n=1 Tax=Kribbella sp. NPDC051586 TaxID=3364118 RepID=UPI0037A60C7B